MRKTKFFMILFIVPLLVGCWDERLLRESRTVYLSGFDIGEDHYFTTSMIRDMNISESSRGEISISDELVTGQGKSIRETSIDIDRSVAGDFDPAKGRVIILGNDIAQEDIYHVLDSNFRDPRVNINAKLVVTNNSAHELITHLHEKEVEKGEYLYEMIKSSEKHTEVQDMTLRTVRTYLFDKGRDFTLPYLVLDEESNEVKMQGSALFNDHSFTGEFLSANESTLLLFFMGKRSNEAILTEELDEEDHEVISFSVKKVSRELNVEKAEKVHVHMSLELDVEVVDYPPDRLDEQDKIDFLNERLSEILTEKSERLFERLQENHSDVLGLGRELMAYHPAIWEEIKGDNYYERILVIPTVEVNVTSSGTIS